MSAHPDDDVTDTQRAYTAAFVRWFRTRSDLDLRRRETALERMILDSAQREQEAAA